MIAGRLRNDWNRSTAAYGRERRRIKEGGRQELGRVGLLWGSTQRPSALRCLLNNIIHVSKDTRKLESFNMPQNKWSWTLHQKLFCFPVCGMWMILIKQSVPVLQFDWLSGVLALIFIRTALGCFTVCITPYVTVCNHVVFGFSLGM